MTEMNSSTVHRIKTRVTKNIKKNLKSVQKREYFSTTKKMDVIKRANYILLLINIHSTTIFFLSPVLSHFDTFIRTVLFYYYPRGIMGICTGAGDLLEMVG